MSSGTELSSARGITADGNTIVGFGTRNGNGKAFVATVPEPSAMALLAASGALAVRRGRRD